MSKEIIENTLIIKDQELPVLPLRDLVIFPNMVIPLFVGRAKSLKSLDISMKKNKEILLVAQKNPEIDDPKAKDLYDVGTIGSILQQLKLPDGTVKILVEGNKRASIKRLYYRKGYISATIDPSVETLFDDSHEAEALARSALTLFNQYVKLNKKIPPEILTSISGLEDNARLADIIAAHLSLKMRDKQEVLSAFGLVSRFNLILTHLENEADILQMEKRINTRVKKQMEKTQREYFLNEQVKAIQKELGELGESLDEVEEIKKKINKSGMPKEVKEKAEAELKKLKLMPPMSAEATVCRNYLDFLLNVPWKNKSTINQDLQKAQKILDDDHDGLEKVKERISEYLAVQDRVKKLKGPILCFVGAPGVGKTSLARSIARATGRKFVRMSLGGVRDEAEIRGHRRTYIGSLPGKIIQNLIKAKVRNPLFLFDEIDKMAMDFRGDPASALLEVLDPEQNDSFNDHYLEVDYDLSDVMFVTTANTLDIPPALLDRMEVIHLSGYTEDEKIAIATNHLIEKQLKANGLKANEISLAQETIRDIIRYYTREAGVRNLEREISKICRKVVKKILLNKKIKKIVVKPNDLEEYLGVRPYRYGKAEDQNQIGQVTGLAWTEVGGELLTIEAAMMQGKGNAIITGQLGEVMQESIQAAMTVVRSRAERFGIESKLFEKNDIHIHVPEGAIPKDGPSAGIAMCTALVSILTRIPVLANVAMTGEITLRGEILPIGGLKEKLLAARRGGIRLVIIPEENRKDLKEIPNNVKEDLDIHPVRWIDDVFQLALENLPKPLVVKKATKASKLKKTKK